MAAIKRATLEAVILAAKNTYPDEFIALLSSREKNGPIDEFVLLPGVYGKTFSSIRLDLVPYDSRIKGSAHSHPTRNALPSRADLRAFKLMGETHLIIAYPFSFESVKAFDSDGNRVEVEVVA